MGQGPPEADGGPGTRQTFDKHVKPSAGKGEPGEALDAEEANNLK